MFQLNIQMNPNSETIPAISIPISNDLKAASNIFKFVAAGSLHQISSFNPTNEESVIFYGKAMAREADKAVRAELRKMESRI